MKQKNKWGRALLVIAILLLVLLFLYSGLQILESTVLRKDSGTEQQTPDKTIIRDGVEYFPRQDVTVILLSGVDQMGPVQSSGSYNNPGAADMVSLLIFDEKAEKINVFSLNRDTMLDVHVLGIGGKPAGTIFGQLALAHTYGSGLEDSCENLRDTVSDFLYNIQIDYYITMNMDAIAILNDAVGGVTVNVTDDFSAVDPTIPMGEVTLHGQQAINFVRTRAGVADQMNLTRMERHKEYMNGFMTALNAQMDDSKSVVLDAYEQASEYIVTDCTSSIMANLLDRYGDYEVGEIVSVDGENKKGAEFMEYYVDEAHLDTIMLDYLYAPKKK